MQPCFTLQIRYQVKQYIDDGHTRSCISTGQGLESMFYKSYWRERKTMCSRRSKKMNAHGYIGHFSVRLKPLPKAICLTPWMKEPQFRDAIFFSCFQAIFSLFIPRPRFIDVLLEEVTSSFGQHRTNDYTFFSFHMLKVKWHIREDFKMRRPTDELKLVDYIDYTCGYIWVAKTEIC